MKYRVTVVFEVEGYMDVEADDIEEAMDIAEAKAEDGGIPGISVTSEEFFEVRDAEEIEGK